MDDEVFDSFTAPKFVNFTVGEDLTQENLDYFFDRGQPNRNCRDSKINSNEIYYSPEAQFDFSGIRPNNVEILNASETEEFKSSRSKLRKSLSTGNLNLFCEEEARQEYLSCLNDISEDIANLSVNNEEAAPVAGNNKNLRSSSARKSKNPSLESINKLAQPKRYGSTDALKRQSKTDSYVPLAEAVYNFQKRTPLRFRTKPDLVPSSQPLQNYRTIPESPALQTKGRIRAATHILTQEEKELIEFENAQKFKIKANPVNKKVLQGPLKPVVAQEKKCTVPQPFNLTAVPPKKVVPSPQKFKFHANPMPNMKESWKRKSVENVQVTKPITPTFMKNYKPINHNSETKIKVDSKDKDRPRLTKLEPFSFDEKNKLIQRKREQLIHKILMEEKKAREFHAKPLPVKLYSKKSMDVSDSSSTASKKTCQANAENLSVPFKAKSPTVLRKEPFVPAKGLIPLTQQEPFNLEIEQRSQKWQQFEEAKRKKEKALELLRKRQEEERLEREKKAIAEIRKEAEFKAQNIRTFKPLVIQPSGNVTMPVSPKFHYKKTTMTDKDKENQAN